MATSTIKNSNLTEKTLTATAQSISAGSTKWIDFPLPSDWLCASGYYLEGGANCSVYFIGLHKSSNVPRVALRNSGSSAQTVTVSLYYLATP